MLSACRWGHDRTNNGNRISQRLKSLTSLSSSPGTYDATLPPPMPEAAAILMTPIPRIGTDSSLVPCGPAKLSVAPKCPCQMICWQNGQSFYDRGVDLGDSTSVSCYHGFRKSARGIETGEDPYSRDPRRQRSPHSSGARNSHGRGNPRRAIALDFRYGSRSAAGSVG